MNKLSILLYKILFDVYKDVHTTLEWYFYYHLVNVLLKWLWLIILQMMSMPQQPTIESAIFIKFLKNMYVRGNSEDNIYVQ